MSELKSWSGTASSNSSASPDGFPEGMAPSGVNDSAREVMAALARYRADTDGVNSSTGSSNAYALAASTTYTAYAQGDLFTFKANHANTGAATLNVDSVGAKDIRRMDGTALLAGDIPNGAMVTVSYDGTNFQLLSSTPFNVNGLTNETSIASGDKFPFFDVSATAMREARILDIRGLAYISTGTASSSASLEFTSGFDSAKYSSYIFSFESISPATDNVQFCVRFSNDGGSTYLSTSIYQTYRIDEVVGSSVSPVSITETTSRMSASVGNQSDEVLAGELRLWVNRCRGHFVTGYANGSTVYTRSHGGCHVPATANAVQFFMSSGNIASGSVHMYGVKKV